MKLNKNKIIEIFSTINNRLKDKNEVCTIEVFGGASMCLLFQSRDARDIDATISMNDKLAEVLLEVTKELNLEYDWLDISIMDYLRIVSLEEVDEIISEYYIGEIGCIYQDIINNKLNEVL